RVRSGSARADQRVLYRLIERQAAAGGPRGGKAGDGETGASAFYRAVELGGVDGIHSGFSGLQHGARRAEEAEGALRLALDERAGQTGQTVGDEQRVPEVPVELHALGEERRRLSQIPLVASNVAEVVQYRGDLPFRPELLVERQALTVVAGGLRHVALVTDLLGEIVQSARQAPAVAELSPERQPLFEERASAIAVARHPLGIAEQRQGERPAPGIIDAGEDGDALL